MGSEGYGDLKGVIREVIPELRQKPFLVPGRWIRVSGLAYLCAREEVLCSRNELVRDDNVNADLMMIFEHGHGLHWDLQNRVLPLTGTLYGRWLCGSCGTYHGGEREWDTAAMEKFEGSQILRPTKCSNCGAFLFPEQSLYHEQHVKDHQYRLMGHPDGFIRLEGYPGLGVLEIKTISSRGAYEVRNCAKLDHVTQAQCYMWMTGCRWGKVLYWDKGTVGMSGLIEHTVEYDEDHVEAMQNLVSSIWAGVEGGKLPERICASPDCKRAELCSSVKACFEAAT